MRQSTLARKPAFCATLLTGASAAYVALRAIPLSAQFRSTPAAESLAPPSATDARSASPSNASVTPRYVPRVRAQP